jgi:hypothetical protein
MLVGRIRGRGRGGLLLEREVGLFHGVDLFSHHLHLIYLLSDCDGSAGIGRCHDGIEDTQRVTSRNPPLERNALHVLECSYSPPARA